MVRSGSVFVVLFSIMKGLKNIPDVVPDPRVLKHSTSPIAVFVSTKVGRFGRKPNTLKPVAIQIDETPGYAWIAVLVINYVVFFVLYCLLYLRLC